MIAVHITHVQGVSALLAAERKSGLIRAPRAATAVLLPLLLAWIAVAVLPDQLHVGSTLLSFLRLAFSFGLGTLAFVWRDRLALHGFGVVATLFVFAVALGTHLEVPAGQLFVAYTTLWLAGLPIAGPLAWIAALPRRDDLSYGVYIYDWLIAQSLLVIWPGLTQPQQLAATLTLLLPTAALSWFLNEKPALGWKRARPAAPNVQKPEELPVEFPQFGLARNRLIRISGAAMVQE